MGVWQPEQLPRYAPTAGVHIADESVAPRVTLNLSLETSLPIIHVSSDTHPLVVRDVSSTQQDISFKQGKVLDNRDFVIRYSQAATRTDAGLLSHWQSGGGGYFSLLIEPPEKVDEADVLPREMVFLLDCSGSINKLK